MKSRHDPGCGLMSCGCLLMMAGLMVFPCGFAGLMLFDLATGGRHRAPAQTPVEHRPEPPPLQPRRDLPLRQPPIAPPPATRGEPTRPTIEPPANPLRARRTWSIDGEPVEATFASMSFGRVNLETTDGKTIQVDLTRLSDADREFIQRRGREP